MLLDISRHHIHGLLIDLFYLGRIQSMSPDHSMTPPASRGPHRNGHELCAACPWGVWGSKSRAWIPWHDFNFCEVFVCCAYPPLKLNILKMTKYFEAGDTFFKAHRCWYLLVIRRCAWFLLPNSLSILNKNPNEYLMKQKLWLASGFMMLAKGPETPQQLPKSQLATSFEGRVRKKKKKTYEHLGDSPN